MPTPSEQDAMQFMNAVINKDVDDARRYLQKGVPTNIALVSDDNKFHHCSPLMIAAIQNDADMVHLLVTHSADVDWINKYGATALTYAAAENQPRALEALLLREANANITENWNGGPLHWAAQNGNKTNVQLLLDAGADATIKNKNGKTPADCATAKGHSDLSVYLEHAENSWKRQERNPNEIVNRSLPTQDYGITSIFNFKSMTVTKIVKDFATLKNSHETLHFSHPAAEKDKVITASTEFEKQGGKIDTTKFQRALHTITPQDYMPRYRHKINRRTPPGS